MEQSKEYFKGRVHVRALVRRQLGRCNELAIVAGRGEISCSIKMEKMNEMTWKREYK